MGKVESTILLAASVEPNGGTAQFFQFNTRVDVSGGESTLLRFNPVFGNIGQTFLGRISTVPKMGEQRGHTSRSILSCRYNVGSPWMIQLRHSPHVDSFRHCLQLSFSEHRLGCQEIAISKGISSAKPSVTKIRCVVAFVGRYNQTHPTFQPFILSVYFINRYKSDFLSR
jgi:hypothetical protein